MIKLGAAVILEATSLTSFPFALPIKESIRLSPSSSNSDKTFFKAYLVLTFSGTISSSVFLDFLVWVFGATGAVMAFGASTFFWASFSSGLAAGSDFLVSSFFGSVLAGGVVTAKEALAAGAGVLVSFLASATGVFTTGAGTSVFLAWAKTGVETGADFFSSFFSSFFFSSGFGSTFV